MSQDADKPIEDIQRALEQISGATHANQKSLEYVKEQLKKEPNKYLPVLQSVAGAIPKLMSDDPKEIIVGILDTIGAVAPLAGPEGEVISVILSFVAALFGGSKGPSVADVVKQAIDEALTEYKVEELTEDLAGVSMNYRNSLAYINAVQGKHLTQHEISQLSANVPIWQGVQYLGKVSQYIRTESEKSDNKTQADAARVLTFLQLFIQLTLTRQMLLNQLCEIVTLSKDAPNTAAGIAAQIVAQQDDCKNAVAFLNNPDVKQALYYSVYSATRPDWPCITPYIKEENHDLDPGVYIVSPQTWPTWYISCNIGDGKDTWRGSDDKNTKIQLHFRRATSKGDEGYWLISNGRYTYFNTPEYNFSFRIPFTSFVMGSFEPKKNWKIIRTKDHKCMFANKERPSEFIYMQNGWFTSHLIFAEGDPGQAGYWNFDKP